MALSERAARFRFYSRNLDSYVSKISSLLDSTTGATAAVISAAISDDTIVLEEAMA
jgi:hypothetical protein